MVVCKRLRVSQILILYTVCLHYTAKVTQSLTDNVTPICGCFWLISNIYLFTVSLTSCIYIFQLSTQTGLRLQNSWNTILVSADVILLKSEQGVLHLHCRCQQRQSWVRSTVYRRWCGISSYNARVVNSLEMSLFFIVKASLLHVHKISYSSLVRCETNVVPLASAELQQCYTTPAAAAALHGDLEWWRCQSVSSGVLHITLRLNHLGHYNLF